MGSCRLMFILSTCYLVYGCLGCGLGWRQTVLSLGRGAKSLVMVRDRMECHGLRFRMWFVVAKHNCCTAKDIW